MLSRTKPSDTASPPHRARRSPLVAREEARAFSELELMTADPITVVMSEKGWIRAMKGHIEDTSKLDFKQGDELWQAIPAFTTDKLILFATNGKFFTLEANELPGGRGHGEPVRLMVDLEGSNEFIAMFVHQPGRKLLVGSTAGHGFIVPEDEVIDLT